MEEENDYPDWCCHECAMANGGRIVPGHMATYHEEVCGVCKLVKAVTEPRDYRWPKFKKVKSKKVEIEVSNVDFKIVQNLLDSPREPRAEYLPDTGR